jgi:hypothetical protein
MRRMPRDRWVEQPAEIQQDSFAKWISQEIVAKGELHAAGPCPRCGDEVGVTVKPTATVVVASAASAGQLFHAPTLMVCNCPDRHPGRPKTRASGCGAWWVAQPRYREDADYDLEPVTQPHLIEAARTVHEGAATTRDGIRLLAEKWIPGFAAITGALGVGAVGLAAPAVVALPLGPRAAIYGLAVAAILAATASSVVAYRAAFGWPKTMPTRNEGDVVRAAAAADAPPEAVAGRLRWALGLAAGALAALLAAVGILWLWPASANPALRVTYLEGANLTMPLTGCGELLGVHQNALQLRVGGSPEKSLSIPLDRITDVDQVTACGR